MIELDSLVRQFPQELSGFKRNILVEYLQLRVLATLFGSAPSAKLCLIGGTAVRLVHEGRRFSEDLDFDNLGLTQKQFVEIAKRVAVKLKQEGYAAQLDFSFSGAFRCFLKFPGIYNRYGLSGHKEEKLLLQMDAEKQGVEYPRETKIINRLGVFTRVLTPVPATLLSMKLAALLGRSRAKGRDFYDVTYLSAFTKADFAYLSKKNGISDGNELKNALLKKISGLKMREIATDVSPFLFSKEDVNRVLYFGDYIRHKKAW